MHVSYKQMDLYRLQNVTKTLSAKSSFSPKIDVCGPKAQTPLPLVRFLVSLLYTTNPQQIERVELELKQGLNVNIIIIKTPERTSFRYIASFESPRLKICP